MKHKPKVRVSLSVINFKDKIKKVWKLEEWQGVDDPAKHVLFFGLYTKHDFDAWWYAEPEERSVFWCGSDILNVLNNTEFQRRLKLYPNTKHYCETKEEYENLKSIGIEAEIIPSFLESEKDFPISFKPSENPHIWMCVHPYREVEYGLDVIYRMAKKFPDYTFHIYGTYEWIEEEQPKNVLFHGQVPNEQLNKEIKQYQCGFRGNKHEGISEVLGKSILLGQYYISRMKLPEVWYYENEEEVEGYLKKLREMKSWNKSGRRYWKGSFNKFPWLSI
jgi:hypothetical protein